VDKLEGIREVADVAHRVVRRMCCTIQICHCLVLRLQIHAYTTTVYLLGLAFQLALVVLHCCILMPMSPLSEPYHLSLCCFIADIPP
jgi:hypothetical protein